MDFKNMGGEAKTPGGAFWGLSDIIRSMDIQPLEILKWVGLAFVAGFIGYFGRYLSMAIIERMRRRKPMQATAEQPKGEINTSQEKSIEQQKIKLEKKKAKAAAKRLKKTGNRE